LGGNAPKAAFTEAKSEALRAVQLDDHLAIAHAVLGSVLLVVDLSWVQAEREFKRALRLDPQCVRALQGYGCLLMRAGRLSEARQMIGQARALEPASPILGVLEARISYYGREYARARDELRIVLDREPGFPLAHFYLALSYSYLGVPQQAETEMEQAGLSPDALAFEIAWLRARDGRREPGLRLLDGGSKGAGYLLLAGELGWRDQAVAVLEHAFREKWPIVLAIGSDPRFDSLRGDQRFSALLRRAGFTN
jgi:tetratricopeptide (TPR) repeat protein